MTCGFCYYEFCWACGASSTQADNHFGPLRGCGVAMMDESAKAGERGNIGPCRKILKIIGLVLLCIILWPFALVLYMPIASAVLSALIMKDKCGWCGAIIFAPIGFVIGLILDICFIPVAILVTLGVILYWIFKCFACIFCNRCHCTSIEATRRAEEENRQTAERHMKAK